MLTFFTTQKLFIFPYSEKNIHKYNFWVGKLFSEGGGGIF